MKCALCGSEFDENSGEAQSRCGACPLGKKCNMVCCPNCGYSTPLLPRRKKPSGEGDVMKEAGENAVK